MHHDTLAMTEYHAIPRILVLGDSAAAFARARAAIEESGCIVGDCIDISDAARRLDRQVAAAAVFAEFDADHAAADQVIERLDAFAAAGRFRSIVVAPPGMIDAVAVRAVHPDIIHLCEPSARDRAMAIGLACAVPAPRLHDVGKGQSSASLQQLSEEVGRIATILATLSDDAPVEMPADTAVEGGENEISAASVRAIIRARRLRDRYFHSELFADPAWDMLLDLMAARLDRQRVAVSSLCIAAAVPATTALRWIKTLTDHGMFVRVADPHDGRRVFIELSDKAAAQLAAYLHAVQRLSPLAI